MHAGIRLHWLAPELQSRTLHAKPWPSSGTWLSRCAVPRPYSLRPWRLGPVFRGLCSALVSLSFSPATTRPCWEVPCLGRRIAAAASAPALEGRLEKAHQISAALSTWPCRQVWRKPCNKADVQPGQQPGERWPSSSLFGLRRRCSAAPRSTTTDTSAAEPRSCTGGSAFGDPQALESKAPCAALRAPPRALEQ